MKTFKFSLESLLVLRDREEQNAQASLAEATAQVDRTDQAIKRLEGSLSGAFGSWDGGSGRRFSSLERQSLASQIADLQRQLQQARQDLQQAQAKRGAAMQELREASRGRQAVSDLREKRFQEHLRESRKQESLEIETIFNARRSAV